MANGRFDAWAVAMWASTAPVISSATLKAALIDSADVTVSTATHDFWNDISVGSVATATLGSKTTTTGTFDAADTTMTAVSGDTAEVVVIYDDTGNAATSQLMLYFDTFTSGMPVTPNGGDITLQWNGAGIASI
jgi:hypothetical protein